MAEDEVIPHVGIGIGHSQMVQLGMSREEALALLTDRPDIQVDFAGEPPVVAFIQSSKHWGSYEGIDLFEDAADEVIAEIVRRKDLDATIYSPGRHQYYFPSLNMILWRSCVSSEEGDQGHIFDCVSLHTPGYYAPELMEFIRRQSGLPPVPESDAEPGAEATPPRG